MRNLYDFNETPVGLRPRAEPRRPVRLTLLLGLALPVPIG